MPKILAHLWYDREAVAAATQYIAAFPDGRIISQTSLPGTPSGTVDLLTIELAGQQFSLIAAGPYFKFTPAVSFLVSCASKAEVDAFWTQLSAGGKALMPLGSYPFSPWYGWTEDRYGLSWQVMDSTAYDYRQKITPTLMFTGANCGRAEEAIRFWTGIFGNSAIRALVPWGKEDQPERPELIKHGSFTLENQDFAAMDSSYDHGFGFNEAISFIVNCDNQAEIDHYWAALSAVPEAEQCGWLKDRFGLSWQIVPRRLEELMGQADAAGRGRITQAFLQMKKFDIAGLERAAAG